MFSGCGRDECKEIHLNLYTVLITFDPLLTQTAMFV